MEGMGRRHPDNLRIYTGVNNKWQHITGILPWVDTGWDEVAYVGDAENDLECIKAARWSACPNDAVPIIKENAKFVSQFNGGRGAVYEFASQILERIKDNVG
jgi:3-deoxy-D-manno-octulosonate 8-phosphate phosphatase (KDO 8-P phosphatase)